jgi:hypothetical protein
MASNDTEQTRLNELLGDLSRRDAGLHPPAGVQRAVMERWLERQAGPSFPRDAVPSASGWYPLRTRVTLGLAGVAATLVLAAWVLGRPVENEISHTSIPEMTENLSTHPVIGVPAAEAVASSEPGTPPQGPPSIRYTTVPPTTSPVRAVAADVQPFVRLMPTTEQELEGIRLARVRMRGQAARTLGLELDMPSPGADGFVEAEVLLGEDGLARAIRFVR